MATLKTNYKDDILDTSVNTQRKYRMVNNADGTISLEDVTVYTQNGDSFGAADINKTNQAVLDLNSSLNNVNNIISVSENISYVKIGRIVICNINALKIDGDMVLNIPDIIGWVVASLRDHKTGNFATLWISDGNKLSTYKATNFTSGNIYSGIFSYLTNE